MLKKLRVKFICITMSLVFALLCVIFGTIYGFTAINLERDSLQLMHAMTIPPGSLVEKIPDFKVPYLVLQQNMQGFWIAQGTDHYDLTDQAFLTDLLQAVSEEADQTGILRTYDLRYLRTETPTIRYVFMDISAEQTTLRHLIRNCVIIGIASLVAFFGIILLFSRWALKPVDAAWNYQKQFVADASHELKTPLAVILTNAELLTDCDQPPEAKEQFSQNILTMSRQMRNLVEGLLELARLDNVTPAFQLLDFSALTENALLPFEPVFFEQELHLESSILPGLWVKGSSAHLQQIIEIFLDNAGKYATSGTVTLKLDKAGNHALLTVENAGTPLTLEEANNIFRRFYRTDPSRSRNGSYGLGLSIAQKITLQHGGKIWAEGTAIGNRFSLLIPLSHRENPNTITE